MAQNSDYISKFSIYRARKSGGGAAISLSPSLKQQALYLNFAGQVGEEKKFDWNETNINVKLGNTDIGDLLATLLGRQQKSNLYHSFNGNVTKIYLEKSTGEYVGFNLRAFKNKQGEKEEDGRKLSVFLSIGDGVLFAEALRYGFQMVLGWERFLETPTQQPSRKSRAQQPEEHVEEADVMF